MRIFKDKTGMDKAIEKRMVKNIQRIAEVVDIDWLKTRNIHHVMSVCYDIGSADGEMATKNSFMDWKDEVMEQVRE